MEKNIFIYVHNVKNFIFLAGHTVSSSTVFHEPSLCFCTEHRGTYCKFFHGLPRAYTILLHRGAGPPCAGAIALECGRILRPRGKSRITYIVPRYSTESRLRGEGAPRTGRRRGRRSSSGLLEETGRGRPDGPGFRPRRSRRSGLADSRNGRGVCCPMRRL